MDQAVKVGSLVCVRFQDGEEKGYRIVHTDGNPYEGTISKAAPLARAILGAQAGEEKEVYVNGSPTRVFIVSVSS